MRVRELRKEEVESTGFANWLSKDDIIRLPPIVPGVTGFSDRILNQIWYEIEKTGSREIRQELEAIGLEFLHLRLTAEQIHSISNKVNVWANREIYPLINGLLEGTLELKSRFYIATLSVIRFYVPYRYFQTSQSLYETSRYFDLKIHNPHLDSWFGFPEESLNIWVSLGRTRESNGLIFYPEAEWLTPSPADPDQPLKTWALGRPTVLGCAAKEILLFNGDIAHGTCLNRTQETRVSATFRIFWERPDKKTPYFFQYRRGGSTFEKLIPRKSHQLFVQGLKIRYRLSSRIVPQIKRLKGIARGIWRRRVVSLFRSGGEVAPIKRAESKCHLPPVTGQPHSPPQPIPLGKVEVVSAKSCRVMTENGWMSFARFCPHKGGDLSHARYCQGQLRCAWHDVGFSTKDGSSECTGIAALQMQANF